MLPRFLHHFVVLRPRKQTALLLAVVALSAGLQAKNNDPLPPAVTTVAGSASQPRPADATASAAPSNQPAANAGKRTILRDAALTMAPAIMIQPVSQTVPAGYTATFTASASGIPAPAYQWQKGGVPISGATASSYTIASAGPDDAGNYSVVAANTAGTATSEVAELKTVVAPPGHAVVAISIQ